MAKKKVSDKEPVAALYVDMDGDGNGSFLEPLSKRALRMLRAYVKKFSTLSKEGMEKEHPRV